MIKILNAEPDNYSDQARQILQEIGEVQEKYLSHTELLTVIDNFDVLITRLKFQIDRALINRAENLKVIVSATTGLDHIDLECARERGVTVLSLRGEVEFLRSITATPEHTWALLLSLTRRIPAALQAVKEGGWNRDRFRGRDLYQKRLGLVGVGRVGQRVAQYALAFGMEVGGYDPFAETRVAGATYFNDLYDLLAWSAIVSLHVPFGPETHRFIGAKELYAIPQGSYLINTARGGVVDEAALLEALESGHLGGAALDVLQGEQGFGQGVDSPLVDYARKKDNLLITPHIAGATHESMTRTEVFMAEKLRRFLSREAIGGQGVRP